MLYIRQIMELLNIDELSARKVMDRMVLDFSEASNEAFEREVFFVHSMQNKG